MLKRHQHDVDPALTKHNENELPPVHFAGENQK